MSQQNLKYLLFFLLGVLFVPFQISFAQQLTEDDQEVQKIEKQAKRLVQNANELLQEEDFIAAEKVYRKAISKQGTTVAGNYNLGNSYYEKGNFDEALFRHTEAAKVATTKSEKHQAFHNLGNVLMQKKQCEDAAEAFKRALRNDPTDDETRYNYALAKECAEQQKQDQQNDENNKDKDKEEEKKDEDKKDGDNENEDQNQDQKDENDQEGDEKKENEGKPKDDKKDGEKGDKEDKKPQQPQPQPGQLSPQQIKSLLEAMNNQEQKVQEKLNAEKQKGKKVKTEKDW